MTAKPLRPASTRTVDESSFSETFASRRHGSSIRFEYVQYFRSTQSVVPSHRGWIPPVDVFETPHEVVVEVNLGGVKPDEVTIQFTGQRLDLSGFRREHDIAEQRHYHTFEIERGAFARHIELPVAVDPRTAEASFHDGLLVLRVKKHETGFVHGCYSVELPEGLE